MRCVRGVAPYYVHLLGLQVLPKELLALDFLPDVKERALKLQSKKSQKNSLEWKILSRWQNDRGAERKITVNVIFSMKHVPSL